MSTYVFARANLQNKIELVKLSDQLAKYCTPYGYLDKYFPPDKEAREILFIDGHQRSWEFSDIWWQTVGYGKYDRPDILTLQKTIYQLSDATDLLPLVDWAVAEHRHLRWHFLASSEKLTSTTRYSITLSVHAENGLLQYRDNRNAPFQLRLETPSDFVASSAEVMHIFWETALDTFECLKGGGIVTVPGSDRPFLRLPDESTYHTIPRRGRDLFGINVEKHSTELAYQTAQESIVFWQKLSGLISLEWFMPVARIPSDLVNEQLPQLFEISPTWDFLLRGHYRENFSLASLQNQFPPEGYWRFPLAVMDGNDAEDTEVYVNLVYTPVDSFVEFISSRHEYIRNIVAGSQFADKLEFWEGPAHNRWGLDQLKFASFDLIKPKAASRTDETPAAATIQDLYRIDVLRTSDSGGPLLIIVDPGNLAGTQRLEWLRAKIERYRLALNTPEFQAEHPDWRNAKIQVTCAVAPTEDMRKLSSVVISYAGQDVTIPIEFETIRRSLG